jgi:hypothetical protein
MTPGVLSATLDVPASTLSFHLKGLTSSGLVSQERDGRNLIYRPDIEQMNALIGYLSAHCCQGEDCGLVSRPAASAVDDAQRRVGPVPRKAKPTQPMTTHILILCTHNSARSVLAEGMLNHWAGLLGRDVRAHSAGSAPSGRVNPFAIEALSAAGIDTAGYRSKSWDEFAASPAHRRCPSSSRCATARRPKPAPCSTAARLASRSGFIGATPIRPMPKGVKKANAAPSS